MKDIKKVLIFSIVVFVGGLVFARLTHLIVDTFLYVCLLSIPETIIWSFVVFRFAKHRKSGILALKKEHGVIFSATAIGVLSTLLFLTAIPLNVDRSFSVWMLNQMSKNEMSGTYMTKSQLAEVLAKFMEPTGGEAQRRIFEQLSLGNIEHRKDGYSLTHKGKLQVLVHRLVSQIFGTNTKYAG
jgi:hypothetical protein